MSEATTSSLLENGSDAGPLRMRVADTREAFSPVSAALLRAGIID
jgi:hypothetical protein